MRIGAKKTPFYRVVAVDERAKRTGGYIELLGTYNPLTEPKEIKLKTDRIDYWISQGAQLSTGYLRIIGKAPQRLPRKPKKEKKEEPKTEAAPAETPEAPKENVSEKTVEPEESTKETDEAEVKPEENTEQKESGEKKEAAGERST